MTNDFAVKKRTIHKLKEESGTIRQYANLILYLYGAFLVGSLLMMFCGILFRDTFTAALTVSEPSGFWSSAVTAAASLGTDNQPLNSLGQFNLTGYLVNTAGTILSSGMICYLAYSIRQIFRAIEQGETPFTEQNISYWKRCSQFFSALAVILFLLSMLFRGIFILTIMAPLLASCFFYAIALIFEYGSCLQTESDETL